MMPVAPTRLGHGAVQDTAPNSHITCSWSGSSSLSFCKPFVSYRIEGRESRPALLILRQDRSFLPAAYGARCRAERSGTVPEI